MEVSHFYTLLCINEVRFSKNLLCVVSLFYQLFMFTPLKQCYPYVW